MAERPEHCAFKKLNRNGKCIAKCHENIERGYDSDCTGNTGLTIDYEGGHEVRIAGHGCAIDGRDYFTPVHHKDGTYSITPTATAIKKSEPAATSSTAGDIAYGWGTYLQKDGRVYRWITDDQGNRVKEYIR